jgi:hypothetical protein
VILSLGLGLGLPLGLACLLAQDLIQRSSASPPPSTPPPSPAPPRAGKVEENVRRIPFPRDLQAGSVALADFLAPLVAEEEDIMRILLEDPEKWLAKSGLTLLCQTSPTLCNVFKHVRSNANAARESVQDTVRGLEEKVPGLDIVGRSEILRDCLREALAKGRDPASALRACFDRDKLKSVLGEWVDRLDLAQEITRWLKLDDKEEKLLREMLRPIRITAKGIELVDDPTLLQRRFRERVDVWTARWREAVDRPGRASKEVEREMARVGLTRDDLGRMASLADWMKDRSVSTLSNQLARIELEDEAARVDAWLAAIDGSAGLPEYIKAPARQLRAETRADLETIRRKADTAARLQRAVTALRDDVDAEINRRLAAGVDRLILRAEAARLAREGREWGGLPK